MTINKRWVGVIAGLAVVIAVVAFARALPAPTACLAINAYGFESASERFLIPADSSESEREKYEELIRLARARIQTTFGQPEADPIVVFFNDPRAFWPLYLNLHGQAPTIGSRACLIIGPEGQNVDIVAHELMHAEMHHRVGSWALFQEVPAWFDEGIAMQVDFRERYDVSPEQLPDTTFVRQLTGYREFFNGKDSYAAARREVGAWLARAGSETLYGRLERLQNGEQFNTVMEHGQD